MTGNARSLLCVCTKDRSSDLERAIKSFIETDNESDILIIDASSDENYVTNVLLVEQLRSRAITHVRTQPSLTKQRNYGKAFAESKGYKFLHFVDDDVEFVMPYITPIENSFDLFPSVAGITCNVVDDQGLTPRGRLRKAFGASAFDGKVSKWGSNYALPIPGSDQTVDWLPGCAMSYRVSMIKGLTFDERRQGYSLGEDVDFSLAAKMSGELRFLGNIRIVHHLSATNREDALRLAKAEVKNRFLLASNHPKRISAAAVHGFIWINAAFSVFAALALRELSLLNRARGLIIGLYNERFSRGIQVGKVTYVLNGGLGNQLFILAAGLSHARANDLDLLLDASAFSGGKNLRQLRLTSAPLPPRVEIAPRRLFSGNYYGKGWTSRFLRIFNNLIRQKISRPLETDNFGPHVGYFQDNYPSNATVSEIQEFLDRYPLAPEILNYMNSEVRESYAIHLRLGDYLLGKNLQVHGHPSTRYYLEALRLVSEADPNARFIIFSDSPELVDPEILGQPNVNLATAGLDDMETLRILSAGKGLIMSNSSFSWWGGRLGAFRTEDFRLVAPHPWYSQPGLSGPPVPAALILDRVTGEEVHS